MDRTSYNEMRRFVLDYLNRDVPCSILDIGSMDVNGSYRRLFRVQGWRYTGLDLSSGKNVDVVVNSPYDYPFADESFDFVVSGQTLEHVEDPFNLIREAARVLKRKGMMCLIAPMVWYPHSFPKDCWRILPDGMNYLLSSVAGLDVIDVHAMRRRTTRVNCVGIARKPER